MYLRGPDCLRPGCHRPLCSSPLLRRRLGFQQARRWWLLFNKAILQSFHTRKKKKKKTVWGRQTLTGHAKFTSPQSGVRQKKSLAHLPDTKKMCSVSKFKPVNSAHYPRSWSVILCSCKQFQWSHSHNQLKAPVQDGSTLGP